MSSVINFGRTLFAAALLGLIASGHAHAANSILIWPIDPVIESDERATALWLENRGSTPAQMQLRVLGWSQKDGHDAYANQSEVIGSPPMIRIAPGQKQLIRLTRTVDTPAGTERSYRVLIDEIPTQDPIADGDKASVGIKFQMRYSVPLFVDGAGVWTKDRPEKKRDAKDATRPALSWRTVVEDGKTLLEVRNTGVVHAKLAEVSFRHGETRSVIAEGLLGYILPGNRMRWPLPEGAKPQGELIAKINGTEALQTISAASASR
ncbi:MAG: fimbrial biogenesis chaperone [Lysobacter sp.]